MLEPPAIRQYLEKNAWSVAPTQYGWNLRQSQIDETVFMSMTPHWLCFTTPLTIANGETELSDEQLGNRVNLLRLLLEQNEQMFMTKFSLDADDQPVLMTELPLKLMEPFMLTRASACLSHYLAHQRDMQSEARERLRNRRKRRLDPPDLHDNDVASGISKETLMSYIQSLGARWFLKDEPLSFPWHLGYAGIRVFDIYLTVTKNWTYFQIPILTERVASVLEAAPQLQSFFLEYLLHLNNMWFMAKIGVDANNQVLLLVEVPTETLTLPLLRLMASTIVNYLDRFQREIQIMASLQKDSQLIDLLHMAVS